MFFFINQELSQTNPLRPVQLLARPKAPPEEIEQKSAIKPTPTAKPLAQRTVGNMSMMHELTAFWTDSLVTLGEDLLEDKAAALAEKKL